MQKKMKDFKQDNAGRSMTEMLGVLAIIGVLSLGGIIGYKLAMNRYAANQIAYEINMMKTDAKVKIMQGNENLTLGQPYDGGTIRFGDYATTFGCSFIKDADDESVVEEAATCQVANAYYIELQHIPEGICKPLANLIENMNDLIAFDINPKENGEAEEGGNCEEGDNVLNAVFSAEPGDLEVLKCEKKEDCPGGLQCHNHLCVECTEDTDCGKTGHCENNVCEYCESGVWDSATKQCVDCKEPSDCENNPKGKICENNKCVACTDDTHCPDKENAPHCDSETHTCGNCPIGTPYWSYTLSKCVECAEDVHCTDKEINPVCNGNTGECGPCPNEGEAWDKDQGTCAPVVCTTNAECFDHLNQNYYCHKGHSGTTSADVVDHEIGTCKPMGEVKSVRTDSGTFYASNIRLNWWNACRWCEAYHGALGENCGKNEGSQYMVGYRNLNLKCNPAIDDPLLATTPMVQYCHKDSKDSKTTPNENNVSSVIEELRHILVENDEIYVVWLREKGFYNHHVTYLSLYTGAISNTGCRIDLNASENTYEATHPFCL